jgi:hypothetical protein
MQCSPSICIGGTCNNDNNECICPTSWIRQWSLVKADCTTPSYLLETASGIGIILNLYQLYKSILVMQRARGTALLAMQCLVGCNISSLAVWVSTLAQGGFYTAALISFAFNFCFVFASLYFQLSIVVLPGLGMKPSQQHEASARLKMVSFGLGIICGGLLIVAAVVAMEKDIDFLNKLCMSIMAISTFGGGILALILIHGVNRLHSTLTGEISTVDLSHPHESTSLQSNSELQQHNQQPATTSSSRMDAIKRLENIRRFMIFTLLSLLGPLGFVIAYFTTGQAPGFDIFIVLGMLNSPLAQFQMISQLVPKNSRSNVSGGNNGEDGGGVGLSAAVGISS